MRVAFKRIAVLTEVVKHMETASSTLPHRPVRRARLQRASTRASVRARDPRDSTPKLRRQCGASGRLSKRLCPRKDETGRSERRGTPRRGTRSPEMGLTPPEGLAHRHRASIPTVTELSPLRAGDVSVPLIDLDAAGWREAVDPVTAPVETAFADLVIVAVKQRSRRAVSCHAGAGPVA